MSRRRVGLVGLLEDKGNAGAEAPQQAIYDALGVGFAPGGIRKSIV